MAEKKHIEVRISEALGEQERASIKAFKSRFEELLKTRIGSGVGGEIHAHLTFKEGLPVLADITLPPEDDLRSFFMVGPSDMQRVSRQVFGGYVAIMCCIGVTGLICTIYLYRAMDDMGWFRTIVIGVTSLISFAIGTAVFNVLKKTQCPNCLLYGMATLVGSDHLGTREQFRTGYQNVKVYGAGVQTGVPLANIQMPVQERHLISEWQDYCVCKNCSHAWARRRTETRQV